MAISSKRAKTWSIISFAISGLFIIAIFILGRWSGFSEITSVGFFMLSTVLVWFVLMLQFHQRVMAEQEKLDLSQLGTDDRTKTIFSGQDNEGGVFAVAQQRLKLIERWIIPILSAVIAIYEIAVGAYLLYRMKTNTAPIPEFKQPLLCAVILIAIAFVSFVMSRYSTGVSSEKKYKPLRAGGSSLLGSAILCFALAICLGFKQYDISLPLKILAYFIPSLLAVIGIETGLNGILDIYRPRIKAQYSRAAFDSRLLGTINEPGEILHTLAGAIDYQFGFKVSQTWFYKLLAEAFVPLVLFAITVLYLMSCFVVINPNEQAIVERFGNPLTDSNEVRLIEPGIAWKLPWPIEKVRKYPAKKVHEIYIGYKPDIDKKTGLPKPEQQLLWGKEHYHGEEPVMVASRQTGQTIDSSAVPVSILNANMPVQYTVKEGKLYDFLYKHNDPEKHLEAICYREMAKFAASARVEVETEQDKEISILGAGRAKAKEVLTKRIQEQADKAQLGIDVVFVGLQGIHPPVKVAPDYQKAVGAVQTKYAAILNAHTSKNITLSELAGSVEKANELYSLALEYEKAIQVNPQKAKELSNKFDEVFVSASGEIFKTLRTAKSEAFEKSELAKASGLQFENQLKAFNAAPNIYQRQLRLNMLKEALEPIRKFVVIADDDDTQIFIIDAKEKTDPSVYEAVGLEGP